jgi:phosphoglycolate phosphatase
MHLLFDLDGTLSNPFLGVAHSMQQAVASLGLPTPPLALLRQHAGKPSLQVMTSLLGPERAHLLTRAMQMFRGHYARQGLYENTLYPGITSALQTLRADGHTLFIATAKPTHQAQLIIKKADLSDVFQSIYGSELDGRYQDKADLIARLIEMEHLAPENSLMIGDRGRDITGALQNRISGLGALWGFGTRNELTNAGALHCLNTPGELPSAVAEHFAALNGLSKKDTNNWPADDHCDKHNVSHIEHAFQM